MPYICSPLSLQSGSKSLFVKRRLSPDGYFCAPIKKCLFTEFGCKYSNYSFINNTFVRKFNNFYKNKCTMDKKERFENAYNYLKYKGIIKKQDDVAQAMGSTRGNVSLALSGDPKVLTDRFLMRFSRVYSSIISSDWLLTGIGEMLIEDDNKISEPETKTALELKWAKHEITILNELVESLKRENALLHQQLKGKGIDDLFDLPFHHGVADVTQPEPDDVSRV